MEGNVVGRKRKPVAPSIPGPIEKWEVSTEIQINGRNVSTGTELKIKGERGRFRFIKHVKTATSEWVDVWGGPKQAENWRSFHMDKVVRVHSKNQTYQNLAVEYKEKKKAVKEELENEVA
jgi:hypothetical protein